MVPHHEGADIRRDAKNAEGAKELFITPRSRNPALGMFLRPWFFIIVPLAPFVFLAIRIEDLP
jgi:hypothetical protein